MNMKNIILFLPLLVQNTCATSIRGRYKLERGHGVSTHSRDYDEGELLDNCIDYRGNHLVETFPEESGGRYTPAEFDDLSHLWIGWPRY